MISYILWHGNSEDGYTKLLENCSEKEASSCMTKWRQKNAPGLHMDGKGYWRYWEKDDGVRMIDYGSHWNFFKMQAVKN